MVVPSTWARAPSPPRVTEQVPPEQDTTVDPPELVAPADDTAREELLALDQVLPHDPLLPWKEPEQAVRRTSSPGVSATVGERTRRPMTSQQHRPGSSHKGL
jgi:hypothetical protein